MASCCKQQPPHLLHVVAVPYPAQGHISPLLQLCEQLVPLNFTFTFINTHHIHQRLHRTGSICPAPPAVDHSNDAAHDGVGVQAQDVVHHYRGCSSIRMVYIEGGCAPEEHARKSTEMDAFVAAQGICEPVEQLLSQIMEEREVNCFMSDILLGWSSATARKFDLPWLSFWPTSAASLSACIYFSDLALEGDACIAYADMEDMEAPPFEGIPGLPPTNRYDVPKMWDAQGKVNANSAKFYVAMEEACVVLLNSFEELEGQVLKALSKRFPIVAVGPLLPSSCLLHTCPDNEEAGSLSRPSLFAEDSNCLAWLDTQAPSSVLFISFGSISLRSNEQLQELAAAVDASGCPFLWVCKQDVSHGPDTKNHYLTFSNVRPRGLIVSWAPQLQVLSHPSVGGFMTHCGWNSVVESASLGVPMLCWADHGERCCNQRLVVELWKCGINVVTDERHAKQHIDDAVLIDRDDIEKSIRFLMLEEGGVSIRHRSTKLKEGAIKAYQHSHTQLNQFAQTLKQRYQEAS